MNQFGYMTGNEPHGLPLAQQAQAYALAQQRAGVREFQQAARQREAPAEFPMLDVLAAARGNNPLRRVQAVFALQEFLRAPDQMRRKFKAALKEMVTVGDFPAGATIQAYIDKFLITAGEMDNGYEQIFQIHDVATAEAQLLRGEFKMLNIRNGVVFVKRKPGEPVQMKAVTADEVSVKYDMFGAGLGIERVWWDDQDYMLISDIFSLFREAYYYQRSQSFYSLITGLGAGINYNTGADLIAKLNGAASQILRDLQGQGLGVTPQSQFIILVQPERLGEVEAALRTQSDVAMQTAAGKQKVVYRFKPVASVFVPSAGASAGPYVIYPKGKLRGGYRMDLTLFGMFNIQNYTDDISGFGRYAGIIGEPKQIKRIT